MRDALRAHIDSAPAAPGVYRFLGADGRPLYIGMATSVRTRLQTHLRTPSTRGGSRLWEDTADVEWTLCPDVIAALELEGSLIAAHQPPYNVAARSGRRMGHIAVTAEERFPRVIVSREAHRSDRLYWRPEHLTDARMLVAFCHRAWPLRTCMGDPEPGRGRPNPCTEFHIGRCEAPCTKAITAGHYAQHIAGVTALLDGDRTPAREQITARMRTASADRSFEQAAAFRDMLEELEELEELTLPPPGLPGGRIGALAVAVDHLRVELSMLVSVDGRLVDSRRLRVPVHANSPAIAAEEGTRRLLGDVRLDRLLYSGPATDRAVLRALTGATVIVRPRKAAERAFLADAQAAAEEAAERPASGIADPRAGLAELGTLLQLQAPPARIEIYDISHLSGEGTGGVRVLAVDGVVRPEGLRRFAITSVTNDDGRALAEMLSRRTGRWQDGTPGFELPDVILIDGGRPQLRATADAWAPMAAAGTVVLAIAKEDEQLWLPGSACPLPADRDHPANRLCQRLRDHAHNQALRYGRTRRPKITR